MHNTAKQEEGATFLIDRGILYDYRGCSAYVEVPVDVRIIALAAFCGHSEILEISLPETIEAIGRFAFAECCAIRRIHIPRNVAKIEYDAFDGCTALESISVSAHNSCFCAVNGVLFTRDKTQLLKYPPAKNGDLYEIPAYCTTVSRNAFNRAAGLRQVKIPSSIHSIGYKAFCYADALSEITIGENVTSMGYCAFSNCRSLRTIDVVNGNASFLSIDGVLYSKDGSMLLQIPANYSAKEFVIRPDVRAIADRSLTGCLNIESFVSSAPAVETMDGVAYRPGYCELIAYPAGRKETGFTVPQSVVMLGGSSFQRTERLLHIELGAAVNKISRHAFDQSAVETVIFSNVLEHIGWAAFANCKNLRTIDLQNTSLTFINAMAFQNCLQLEKVALPATLHKIERWAFLNCRRLKLVEIVGNIEHQLLEGARFFLDEVEKSAILSS